MRYSIAAITLAAVFAHGAALAAQPAAPRSPDTLVKAMEEAPCPDGQARIGGGPCPVAGGGAASGDAAARPGPCPGGDDRDADGLCPTTSNGNAGFTLFKGSQGPLGESKARAPVARRPIAVRTAVTGAPVRAQSGPPQSGPLSDLLITFQLGSAELTDQGMAQADSFAQALKDPKVAGRRFEIAGYTDVTGAAERNRELSEKRAETVKAFLVSKGVDGSRLEAKGYGSEGLAVPGSPRDPANRRVEARSLN